MKKNNLIINLIKFLKNDFVQKNEEYYLKIFDRNIKIKEYMVGLNFAVYNGKYFIPIRIKGNMVGKILGSFSFSKNIFLFNKKINRYVKKNKK